MGKEQPSENIADNRQFSDTVLQALPGLVAYMDRDLNYRYVNEAYQRWFGVNREQCLRSSMHAIVGEAGVSAVRPQLDAAYSGIPQEFEREVPYKYGGVKTIHVRYIPDRDPSGKIRGIIVIVHDITREKVALKEKEHAERALAEDRIRLHALFTQSADPIVTIAPPTWKFTRCNPSALKLFEVPNEETFLSLGPWDLSPKTQPDGMESSEKAKKMILQAMTTGSHFFEWDHKTISGKTINCNVLLSRVDVAGESYMQATVRDVTQDKIREREFKSIFSDSPLGVIRLDANYRYLSVNPAYEKFIGYSEQELLSKTIVDLTHPDDRSKTLEAIRAFPHEMDRLLKRFEKRYIHKSGQVIWGRVTSKALTDAQGQLSFLSIIEDVSSQKEHEIETNIILETMADGLVIQDKNGTIDKFNPSALSLLGLTVEQLQGRCPSEPERNSPFRATESPPMVALHTGRPIKGALMSLILPDKNERWLSVNAIPFESASGIKVACTFSDITALLQSASQNALLAKQALEEKNMLQSVADNISSQVSKVDRDGRYVFVNKIYYDWFGKTPGEMIGRTHQEVLPPHIYAKAEPYIKRALLGERVEFENQIVTPSNKKLTLQIHFIPYVTAEGNSEGYFTVAHDITALKEAGLRLVQSSKLASLGEMSAGIAHEINNPLAIISGSVGLLTKYANDPEKFASKIETIQKSCTRISRIVAGLKKFSRTDDATHFQVRELSAILKEALVLVEANAKRHSIPILVDCSTHGQVLCDEVEIEQVLINLVNNAIDAVKELPEKWIKLRLYEEANMVVLKIMDSGTGIPEEVRNKMFDPFFTTKRVGEGTGLGLSISKGILDGHKATLSILNDSPNTCLEVRFPQLEQNKNAA